MRIKRSAHSHNNTNYTTQYTRIYSIEYRRKWFDVSTLCVQNHSVWLAHTNTDTPYTAHTSQSLQIENFPSWWLSFYIIFFAYCVFYRLPSPLPSAQTHTHTHIIVYMYYMQLYVPRSINMSKWVNTVRALVLFIKIKFFVVVVAPDKIRRWIRTTDISLLWRATGRKGRKTNRKDERQRASEIEIERENCARVYSMHSTSLCLSVCLSSSFYRATRSLCVLCVHMKNQN